MLHKVVEVSLELDFANDRFHFPANPFDLTQTDPVHLLRCDVQRSVFSSSMAIVLPSARNRGDPHRSPAGGKVFFVGNALVDLFLQSRNWAFGSAVAVMLILVMLVTVTVYMRLISRLSATREDVSLM